MATSQTRTISFTFTLNSREVVKVNSPKDNNMIRVRESKISRVSKQISLTVTSEKELKISTPNIVVLLTSRATLQNMTSIGGNRLPEINTIGTIRSRESAVVKKATKTMEQIRSHFTEKANLKVDRTTLKKNGSTKSTRVNNITPNSISLSRIDIEFKMMRNGWLRGKQNTKSTPLAKIVTSIERIDSIRIKGCTIVGRVAFLASIRSVSEVLSILGSECVEVNSSNQKKIGSLMLQNSGLMVRNGTLLNVSA